jgi:hypothetical protein
MIAKRNLTWVHQTSKPGSNNNQADLKDKSSTGPSLSAVFPAFSIDLDCDPRDCNAAVLVTLTTRAVPNLDECLER